MSNGASEHNITPEGRALAAYVRDRLMGRIHFYGPPRDPARIPVVLDLLRQAWELAPDLRLGQLIVNVSGRNDPHGVEDGEMERLLREYLERAKGEGNE